MDLGGPAVFAGTWLTMMAAMMLPGAVPAVARAVSATGRALTAPLFAGSYLAVWAVFGLVVYAAYEPHGAGLTGAVKLLPPRLLVDIPVALAIVTLGVVLLPF